MKELLIIIFVHCVYEIFTQIEAEILLFFPDKIFRQQNSRDFLSDNVFQIRGFFYDFDPSKILLHLKYVKTGQNSTSGVELVEM